LYLNTGAKLKCEKSKHPLVLSEHQKKEVFSLMSKFYQVQFSRNPMFEKEKGKVISSASS
jgi:hypothetical protein